MLLRVAFDLPLFLGTPSPGEVVPPHRSSATQSSQSGCLRVFGSGPMLEDARITIGATSEGRLFSFF